MSEWWTYRLTDFLMFTPETYYRLFERHNIAIWPLQLVTLLAGAWIVVAAWRRRPTAWVSVPAVLAGLWLLVALAFHWRRYATINLAAPWFAYAFGGQAMLAGLWATTRLRPPAPTPTRARSVGLALALLGLALQPLLGPLLGRSPAAVELFGIAPDPTTTTTLGTLLLLEAPWYLMPIPLCWCLITWATLWSMGAGDAFVMLGVALLASVGLGVRRLDARGKGS